VCYLPLLLCMQHYYAPLSQMPDMLVLPTSHAVLYMFYSGRIRKNFVRILVGDPVKVSICIAFMYTVCIM
jgi:hypothetical protein